MPYCPWDRLLETIYRRRATTALLIPGSPPLIRVGERWRSLQLPPMTQADLTQMVTDRIPGEPTGAEDGYVYYDFWYGDVVHFRAMLWDYPHTRLLVVSPITITRPPPPEPLPPEAGN